jgi:hypothetical protein
VVSPLIKSLPDDGPYAAETCRKLKNKCEFKDNLKYFKIYRQRLNDTL